MNKIFFIVFCFVLFSACKNDPNNKPISELSLNDIRQIQQQEYNKVKAEQEKKYIDEQEAIMKTPPPKLSHLSLKKFNF